MYTCSLLREGSIFKLKKNDRDIIKGGLDKGFLPYGFIFADWKGNDYHLKASGLFFWKKFKLFKNDEFIEEYKLTESLASKVKLNYRGDFVVAGETKFTMNRIDKMSPDGRQYFLWETDSDEYLIQAFCVGVLDIITGMQSVTGTG